MNILHQFKRRIISAVKRISGKGRFEARISAIKSELSNAQQSAENRSYSKAKKHLSNAGLLCFEAMGRLNKMKSRKPKIKPGLINNLGQLGKAADEIRKEIDKHGDLGKTLDGIMTKYIPGLRGNVVKMKDGKPDAA